LIRDRIAPVELRIFTEPQQGASYDDQLRVARASHELGFRAFFRSDHFLHMGPGSGLPGPTESWTTLAGLARDTSDIRLGTLVSSVTFRYPGILAVQVAQIDQMSGGRIELGLGTGWFAEEHRAYGVPFPEKRFGMLEEQLEIITGLWRTPVGETFSYPGEHYVLENCPALPKPAQARVPIIIGGTGAKRTPALAARFATEFNIAFRDLEEVRMQFDRVRGACQSVGRDPADIIYSAAEVVCVGRSDAEFARRAAAIGREPTELRKRALAGSAGEVVDRMHAYADFGASRLYLQVLDLSDLDHLALIASDVVPHV
jgi:F420-dependent oxidoreductase-like protein